MSQSSILDSHISANDHNSNSKNNSDSNNNNNDSIIINKTSNRDKVIGENPIISITSNEIHDDNNDDSDNFEYDNNPFLGTTHLFASGIHDTNVYTNINNTPTNNNYNHNHNPLTPTRPQYLYDSDHGDSINNTPKNNASATFLNSSSSTPHSASLPSSSSSSSSSSTSTDLMNPNNLDSHILTLDQPFNNSTNPNPNNNNNNNKNDNTAEDHRNNSNNSTTDLEPFENLTISMTLPYQENHMTNNQYIYNKDNNITTTATTATTTNNNNNNNNINSRNYKHSNNSISDSSLNDQIVIIGSGEYNDPWGKHAIGYIIRSKTIEEFTGQVIEQEVTRRYSEFHSLYQVLIKLLPTVIIPPIPSKHSIFKYFLNPINAKNDQRIISMRQRRLMAFLNHCNKIEEIQKLSVFQKFLNPNYLWKDVLNSPPISVLPNNNLLAPPLNVTKPSPLHLLLPSPTSLNSVNNTTNNNISITDNNIRSNITTTATTTTNNNYNDTMNKFLLNQNMSLELIETFHLNDFNKLESQINQYLYSLQPLLSKVKNNKFHIHSLSSQFAELGAYYNALSLETSFPSFVAASSSTPLESVRQLQMAIEKVGHSYDVNYVTLEILIENLTNGIEEPLEDLIKFIKDSKRIILFKNLKFVQYQIIINTIHRRKHRLNELKNFENKMQRLDMVLKRDALSSPTIANAIKNINAQNRKTNSDDDDVGVEFSETDSTSQTINDSQLLIQLQLQKSKKRLNKRKKKLKNKFGQTEPEFLSKIERDEEIEKLNKELIKLRDCEALIQLDLQQVIESTLKNLNYLLIFIKNACNTMLKNITKAILNWIKECLTTWHQTKAKIDCI